MSTQEEYNRQQQKKALEAWEKPLSMPKAVPKPVGKKKKSKAKEAETSD